MGFVCDLRSPVWPCRFEKPRMDARGIGVKKGFICVNSWALRLKLRRFGLGAAMEASRLIPIRRTSLTNDLPQNLILICLCFLLFKFSSVQCEWRGMAAPLLPTRKSKSTP